jgi:hypothetical protein
VITMIYYEVAASLGCRKRASAAVSFSPFCKADVITSFDANIPGTSTFVAGWSIFNKIAVQIQAKPAASNAECSKIRLAPGKLSAGISIAIWHVKQAQGDTKLLSEYGGQYRNYIYRRAINIYTELTMVWLENNFSRDFAFLRPGASGRICFLAL